MLLQMPCVCFSFLVSDSSPFALYVWKKIEGKGDEGGRIAPIV